MEWFQFRIVAIIVAVSVTFGVIGIRLLEAYEKGEKPILVGTTDTVSSLDPAGAYDAGSWAVYSNLYQSLLTFERGKEEPVPDAARSCEFTGADLLQYSCELRSDLQFANGNPLTAEAVKFSFDRIRRIKSPQGPLPLLDTLGSVKVRGNTVTFFLQSPDATFPFKIATGAGSIVDPATYEKDRLRKDGDANGSGPYRIDSYSEGREARLVPNTGYRGALGSLGNRVTIRYYDGPGELEKAWQKREIDVAARGLPPEALTSVVEAGARNVNVEENTAYATRSLVFNLRENAPLSEPAVRQAVAAVIDRQALARDVHDRTVTPLYSLIPTGVNGHTTSFFENDPKPDPSRARQLLEEAGIETPVRFRIAYSQGSATDAEAELLRDQLEETGLFEVDVTRHEWAQFQKGFAEGKYDAYCIGWVADFPDPETFVTPVVGSGSAFHNQYRDSRVDRLIRATQRTTDRREAARDFAAIQEIVAEDVPLIPLWERKDYVLSTDGVAGYQYLSDGSGAWRLWELSRI
ncbi:MULTISPECIES: ABC transporter substrate-binding protein [Streptomyces]|uniref:ABC transporter substrate-binding protein n=1 Tax=Streptomyces TaxID=1883 RepID=UPI001D1538C8|nr:MULTISPECIES: ABC transporter substrate-binding protein [Streptomyces]MCC3652125.1 ABC transporter substrate-binding protein [Streptomyces sp. S07_1.15]WSQ73181.1 ABC transporter substrate-binding protein [Streptomyces xinghaiensis]